MGSPEGTCSLKYKPVDMPLGFRASRMRCAERGQNDLASLQSLPRYDDSSQHSNLPVRSTLGCSNRYQYLRTLHKACRTVT
eukprot:scaffold324996_cov20-Prasinocladus_malaysianus.AAC.1